MKCLIVDDEPLAQDIIESYLKKFPDMELAGKCNNALEASEFLKNNKIDLMFLDIQMPEITGMEFLRSLSDPPLVVFCTAYSDFAVEGFELNAIDYLLKPIALDRFTKTIERTREYLSMKNGESIEETDLENDHIFIKSNQKQVKLSYDQIQYVEAFADYVKIYTPEKRYITLQTMKNMEIKLPADKFIRVHRSFIVGIKYISSFNSSELEIGNVKIPVGKNYKDEFLKKLRSKNIL
ncbi:MAG: response regulator transcription factor [Flavobacteriales bacterium]|nr:response regulator transcription factor [Flavobacteriales bacterium]